MIFGYYCLFCLYGAVLPTVCCLWLVLCLLVLLLKRQYNFRLLSYDVLYTLIIN